MYDESLINKLPKTFAGMDATGTVAHYPATVEGLAQMADDRETWLTASKAYIPVEYCPKYQDTGNPTAFTEPRVPEISAGIVNDKPAYHWLAPIIAAVG